MKRNFSSLYLQFFTAHPPLMCVSRQFSAKSLALKKTCENKLKHVLAPCDLKKQGIFFLIS